MARPWLRVLLSCFALSRIAAAQVEPRGPGEEEPEPRGAGTISGRIIDKQTGQPVAEANLDVVGLERRVVTDERGQFTIELPPGKHAVRVWAPGYQPIRVQNVVIWPGAARKLDVPLEPEL